MTHLLDSSAILALYFGETGADRVRELLVDPQHSVALSVLTAAEFSSRLRAEGAEEAFEADWDRLSNLVSAVLPVSLTVVRRSIALRRAATERLPLIDALIAATAAESGAILVHRDPHFASIPKSLLSQELLPANEPGGSK